MADRIAPRLEAFLTGRKFMEDTGLTAADILKLDADEYARLTDRPTVGEIAAQAHGYAPGRPREEHVPQQPTPDPAPQGIDPSSDEYFHAWRANRTRGGEGVGVFDSVSSQSDQYRAATRAQSGRTALAGNNVVESPRLEGRFVRQDDTRDARSAAQRLATPGNAFS